MSKFQLGDVVKLTTTEIPHIFHFLNPEYKELSENKGDIIAGETEFVIVLTMSGKLEHKTGEGDIAYAVNLKDDKDDMPLRQMLLEEYLTK